MAKQDVTVELFYDGVWNTAPAYVRDPIAITRGRGDESGGLTPQTATLTLDNRSGAYNPRNASSSLYGKIGRNTPIRIVMDGSDVRFSGEVSSWKPGRTLDFNPATGQGDAWTEVEAAGVLRRLGQGADPLKSPLRRWILDTDPTAYWPLEDLADAPNAASAVDGVDPMTALSYSRFTDASGNPVQPAGNPKWATGSGIPGSLPVPDFTQGGTLTVTPPAPPAGTAEWRIGFVMVLPRDKDNNAVIPFEWTTTTATWSRWRMQFDSSGIFATAEDGSGTAGWGASSSYNMFDGQPHAVEVEAFDSAGNVNAWIRVDGNLLASFGTLTAPSMAGTVGIVTSITLNPLDIQSTDAAIDSMPQIGHVALWTPYGVALTGTETPMVGHAGESTGDRYSRLCTEQGLTGTVTGASSRTMGVQHVDKFVDLLSEIELTDGGIIYEDRTSATLYLRAIDNLYNQAAALTVDWSAGEVAAPFDPVVDDLDTRNDVTARSTTSGAQAQAVLDVGPMSVQAPPDGVGRYTTQIDVNPAADAELANYAGWALHKGTVDEVRLPRVTVDLVASPGLLTAATAVDIGDRITVANLPGDVGADEVSLIVLGYTETIGSHRRNITFNAAPASAYDVAVQDGEPRESSDGSTLAAGVTASALSLSLASAAGYGLWTTSAEDFPLDLRIGGERVTVSAISGTASPQTATVSARAVNGVSVAWPAGTEVDVWLPAVVAL